MQIFLTVTPQEYREAAGAGRSFAHQAYRIGEDSSLLRQQLLVQTQGGLLTIRDQDAPPVQDPDALTAAVLRECSRRQYTGVLLDFEAPLREDLAAFARRLAGKCRTLYVPASYAQAAPEAVVLICTAISGGALAPYLREQFQTYRGRIALDLQRLRMDFPLPARSGSGTPLSPGAFQELLRRESPSVFFSPDLCARYFTYVQDGQAHFVLFDDADTLRRKLRLGASLGASAAFFMWPEIRDLTGELFR